jgi:molybdopterin-guanine dinucleotide biosynthesis protein A
VNCYVLTGGHSSRMGRSKAGLFLERVVMAATPVFDRVIEIDWRPSENDRAPIFGVRRALELTDGPCFIVAVDFALITTGILRFLRKNFEASNASMLVPVWNGTPQVLCAGYRTCVAPRIAERLASKKYDVLGLLDEVDVELIPEAQLRATFPGEPLMNVNTPADLEAAERIR